VLSCRSACKGNIIKNKCFKPGSKSIKEEIKITTPLDEEKVI